MKNAECRMQNAEWTMRGWLAALIATLALSASGEVVVTNLTAQNWQARLGEAMGAFAKSANQNDPQVYFYALDTALYIATNCPGMEPAQKLEKLAESGYDIANSLGSHSRFGGRREAQRLELLKIVSEHNPRADRRFNAAFSLAKHRCNVCPEAELPKAEEALRQLLLDPKQDAMARLEKLRFAFSEGLTFNLDVLGIAAKVKEQSDDPAVHLRYYTAMNEYMSDMYGGWAWGQEQDGHDPLNEAYSYESRIVFTDKGLADPKVVNKIPLQYHKAWLLDKLERWTEAEQIYLSMTTNTNLRDRADAYVNYARFLEGRAKRFYTPDWTPYLKQALAAYQQAIALGVDPRTPGNWGLRENAVDCAIHAREFGVARSVIGVIVARNKGQTNNFCRIRLGRIAWEEGDWEGVVNSYPGIDVDAHPYDKFEIEDRTKIVKALKLLGREEEELAALEVMVKRAKGKWKSYYQFAHDRLAEKLAAKDGGK